MKVVSIDGDSQVKSGSIERFESVHGLANVAGGIAGIGEDLIDRPLDRIGFAEFEQTLRLNLHSTFLMTRALVDELIYNEARNEVMFIKYLD